MDETIVLFMKYRDTIEEYNKLHRFHFFKRRHLKRQIAFIKRQIEFYNTPDDIFSFVNGIYVLLSTVLYGHIKDESCLENVKIMDQVLEITIDDTFIWFMTKHQWFEVSEPDMLYSVYKNEPPKNVKVLGRWMRIYPKIFSTLYPIITIEYARRENNQDARESEPVRGTNLYEEKET